MAVRVVKTPEQHVSVQLEEQGSINVIGSGVIKCYLLPDTLDAGEALTFPLMKLAQLAASNIGFVLA